MKKFVSHRSICLTLLLAFNISGFAYAETSVGNLDASVREDGVRVDSASRNEGKIDEDRSGLKIAAAIGIGTEEDEPVQQPEEQPAVEQPSETNETATSDEPTIPPEESVGISNTAIAIGIGVAAALAAIAGGGGGSSTTQH